MNYHVTVHILVTNVISVILIVKSILDLDILSLETVHYMLIASNYDTTFLT
jgi:hypothetical protein